MNYKKTIKDNITYHLINTDRFKQISIVLFLTKEFDKESIVYGNLLTNNLMYSSKKYNTKNKIVKEGENNYGAKISSTYGIIGKCESFAFSLEFVNPKYTDNKYLDKTLNFFKEVILNPNVEDGKFNLDYFNVIKNEAIANSKQVKENPNLFASIKYAEIMYKGTPSEYSSVPSEEDINKVTPKSLYNYYHKLFNGECKVDICILGEVEDSIIDRIHNSFKIIKSNNKKLTFSIKSKMLKEVKEKIDSLSFNQSRLYLGYKFNDMSYHELNHVMKVYNTILGTMNDSILFNIVREANSLCYTIGSYVSKYNPSLTIYAGINKSNYEKTIDLIKKCVSDMSDKKVVKRLFDSAKKTINTYLNNYYDDSVAQINNYYNGEFEFIEDIETLKENINKVSVEEVIEINKKIHLSTIYMMKGDNS